jgi:surface polysaccharide O-acyltransferase-like enzyme
MYYADWIRVISVHSVIFVHCLLNAADTTEMYEKDGLEKKDGICKTMAQIGMPMFFYISGMSSTFFNAEKHGYLSFVKGKVNRLLIPLFLAILTLLVPRLYFS